MRLTDLGVGVTYWPELDELLLPGQGLVDVLEVEPQTTWLTTRDERAPYRPMSSVLDRLRALPQAKIIHGVGFPVGGAPPDERHVVPLVRTIEALDAAWASEHLAFNQATGQERPFHTGFLLPPLQTNEGIARAVSTIRSIARVLPVPFAIETGVSYLRPRPDELDDGEFVANIAETADCGILLDLHNLWANERNGRQPLEAFLRAIPLDRVWEMHLAGGFERNGFWLDAHSGDSPAELLAIARSVVGALPNLRALIFEVLPDYVPLVGLDRIRLQLQAMREIWDLRPRTSTKPLALPRPAVTQTRIPEISPSLWENTLGALVIGQPVDTLLGRQLGSDPGVDILRMLAAEARAGMIVDALKLTSRLLLASVGTARFRSILDDFFSLRPPEPFGSSEAEAFAAYLQARTWDVPWLYEVLAFELALIRALLDRVESCVQFSCNPVELIHALSEGKLPKDLDAGRYEVTIGPDGHLHIMILPDA